MILFLIFNKIFSNIQKMVRANKNVAFLVTIILFCNIFLFSKQAQIQYTTPQLRLLLLLPEH